MYHGDELPHMIPPNLLRSLFFEGLERDQAEGTTKKALPTDLMGDKEALDLIRSYFSIPENQRRRLFDLARVLSNVS